MTSKDTDFVAALRALSDDGKSILISEVPLMIERLKKGHDRYEKLRKLNVPQFQELYAKNIRTGIPFDDLVDKL